MILSINNLFGETEAIINKLWDSERYKHPNCPDLTGIVLVVVNVSWFLDLANVVSILEIIQWKVFLEDLVTCICVAPCFTFWVNIWDFVDMLSLTLQCPFFGLQTKNRYFIFRKIFILPMLRWIKSNSYYPSCKCFKPF